MMRRGWLLMALGLVMMAVCAYRDWRSALGGALVGALLTGSFLGAQWLVHRARAQRLDVIGRQAEILGLARLPGESNSMLRMRITRLTSVHPGRGSIAHARSLVDALDAHQLTEDEVLADLPAGLTIDAVRAELLRG